jgi:5-methylcytosine-specific restriction endonuclease McrA
MSRPYIPAEVRRQMIDDAGHRCGYCQTDERLTGIPLNIKHLTPVAAGGSSVRENLWLSCRPCNEIKGARTHAIDPETQETAPLFTPRTHRWSEHVAWSEDGVRILSHSSVGRATLATRQRLVSARRR